MCLRIAWKSARIVAVVYIVFLVGQAMGLVAFLPLLVMQYDRCKALPGRYSYPTRFGLEVYALVISVVLYTTACLISRRDSHGRLLCEKQRVTGSLVAVLAASSFVSTVTLLLVTPEMEYFRTRLKQDIIEYGNASSEIDSIQSYFSCCGFD